MPLSRRAFLAAACAAPLIPRFLHAQTPSADPYTLGVASGYPHERGFTLWTRLAPNPLQGGGMTAPARVSWEVARDEGFRNIAARGTAQAVREWGHSVHVDVDGLEPARWYWYRFIAQGAASPVGRTCTAPARATEPAHMRFAFASCQQYEQGYYAAYRHMAREELDLVVHLGDYIYESSWGRNHVRSHGTPQPVTLEEYRNRYALYKSDADLQAVHASFPWIVTWDDHEVSNDYANNRSQFLDERDVFLARRAAAYQACYEHMPLPAWARPRGPDMQLYASVPYSSLVQFQVLDTRQYRSPQVCPRPERGGGNVVLASACPERLDPAQSMLGARQEAWLGAELGRSRARWNVIAQQTLMAQADRHRGDDDKAYWTDGWDGYPKARERLLHSIAQARVRNPLVIGGDVHMAAVADLRIDFDDPGSPIVATELCGTSITSQGPSYRTVETLLLKNPHLLYANGARRGYVTLDLTRERSVATLRALRNVRDPDSGIQDLVKYTLEDGRPGAQRS